MSHFWRLRLVFWSPWFSFLRTWDTILVVLGFRETLNGHTDAQMSDFNDLWLNLGPSWSILWAQFCDFLWFGVANWGKASRSKFLCKNHVFWVISFFLFIHQFRVPGVRFSSHFYAFWSSWVHFFWFWRVLETGLKFNDFWKVSWESQGWGNTAKWG